MISKNIKISRDNHLLGYFDLLNQKGYEKATEIYTHVINQDGTGKRSSADFYFMLPI